MKYSSALILIVFIPLVLLMAESSDPLTQILQHIILEGNNGSNVNGNKWDSSILKGKITLLVYFDPDERDNGKIFMLNLI